jgi:S1-C subfamily serine protease
MMNEVQEPSMAEQSPGRLARFRQRMGKVLRLLRRVVPFATGVVAAFAGLVLYNLLFPGPHQVTPKEVQDTVAQTMASATPPPAFSAQVYQVIRPSLVLIQSTHPGSNGKMEGSLGSGVIVTDQGDILTCLHVVRDATEIEVIFADGTHSAAKVASSTPEQDIAVLQADTPPAKIIPAVLGNPRAMNIGDDAYAVGNPFGLYGSMSAGVISGFERTFQAQGGEKLQGLIQVDSAVNPGNSGGPLLNRYGQVIGIVVGILNPTDEEFFVGIGFAVPINTAGGAAGSPPY